MTQSDTTSSEHLTSTSKKTVNWRWRIISLLIAGTLIVFMLWIVDWGSFWDVLQRLSPLSLITAFGVYVLLNLFRTFRYIALLDKPLPVNRVFPIGLYHNFLVRLLPFKLGEFAYILLMQRRLNVPIKEGVSSLFGSRLLELLVIILVAAVSLLLSGDVIPNQGVLAWILVLFCVIGGITGFYFSGALLRLSIRVARSLFELPIIETISQKLDSLATELDRLHHPSIFAQGLLWSCFTYTCAFSVNWILLYAIGVRPEFTTLVLLISLGMFATAFPFNISGFGAVELSFAFGFVQLLGMELGEATSIGLMLNGYGLICAGISGLLGYVAVQLRKPLTAEN